jgi:hypothetical protein
MDRRGFLRRLLAGGAALALDPERLLWVPGEKVISIPPAPVIITPSMADIVAAQIEIVRPELEKLFHSSALWPLLDSIKY